MSGYVMAFPDTWEEYEEDYGFTDTEQIYTNGSRLIQSFRVKQWLEHIEVNEDCISRADLIEKLKKNKAFITQAWNNDFSIMADIDKSRVDELDNCISVVMNAPSVVPSRAEGKWVEDGCYPYYVCSNCGQVCEKQCNGVEIEPLFTKYCPNCGARMESDGE